MRNLCTTTSFLLGLAVNLNGKLLDKVGPANLIGEIGIAAVVIAAALALANLSSLSSSWSARRPA